MKSENVAREMTAKNATVDPILITASNAQSIAVSTSALTGTFRPGCTLNQRC